MGKIEYYLRHTSGFEDWGESLAPLLVGFSLIKTWCMYKGFLIYIQALAKHPSLEKEDHCCLTTSALEEWRSGVSNYNITLDTLLASYTRRAASCRSTSLQCCATRGLSAPRFPLPGSWPASTSPAGTRQGARPDGEEKKIFDATQLSKPLYTSKSGGALLYVCYCIVLLVGGITQCQTT